MNSVVSALPDRRPFFKTQRKDNWWLSPAATFVVFSGFIAYANWALFQGEHYHWGNYLSPFYSPEIWGSSPHALLGKEPPIWPSFLKYSPAMVILLAPLGFRMTCYYYRGAYYKAFWADPPACAVGEPRNEYRGEKKLPLLVMNIHRYFLYLALVFIFILSYDALIAYRFTDGLHVNVGSLLMTLNVGLIAMYTLGCHSMRHLIGGRKDVLPKGAVGKTCYDCVSGLNKKHQLFAWCSLFSVALTDVYIRLCSMGVITDFRLF